MSLLQFYYYFYFILEMLKLILPYLIKFFHLELLCKVIYLSTTLSNFEYLLQIIIYWVFKCESKSHRVKMNKLSNI